jgi:ABC-type polysaccharide/polyol phosphate export permease
MRQPALKRLRRRGTLRGWTWVNASQNSSKNYNFRQDLASALAARDLWLFLAWQDIRLRYRRSRIGPFWITLSMAIFCLSLGVIYSQLFKANNAEYLPFLSVGVVFWGLISGVLGELPNLYIDNAAYIKDIKINPFTILFRAITRHVITLGHNIVIIVGIYAYFRINPGFTALLAFPGLALVVLNLVAIGVSLSLFGARFRDVAPITLSLIQVLFFLTPITWPPRLLPADSWVMRANPMAYYLDLTRSPLLGNAPAAQSWIVALCTLAIFGALAAGMYRAKAYRIPFWV